MSFPSTPLTLLGRLKRREMPRMWETSWEEFFDLYHNAVAVCVLGVFRRHGWHDVPPTDLQDVVLSVFVCLFQGHESFDPAKGRFRQFLSTICQRRVVDFLRTHIRKSSKLTSLDAGGLLENEIEAAFSQLSHEEETAFRSALLATMLAALHAEVPPRTHLIFELVKLNGESPETVAKQFGVSRNVIDNTVFKAMKKLREISKREEIQQEL
jgi:RNA polymerase sigma factor (sigma-70 family)